LVFRAKARAQTLERGGKSVVEGANGWIRFLHRRRDGASLRVLDLHVDGLDVIGCEPTKIDSQIGSYAARERTRIFNLLVTRHNLRCLAYRHQHIAAEAHV